MRRLFALICLPLSALAVAACGSTVTASGFQGEQHQVVQTISNLQADATASDEKKVCANDLAATVVAKLGGATGCEAAIKHQLAEVDSLEVSVLSVQVASGGASATANVKSIREGKSHPGTVSLVKESGKWKVSAVS